MPPQKTDHSPQAAATTPAAAASRVTAKEKKQVDRLGELSILIDGRQRLLIDEEETIRKALREFAKDEPPEKPVVIAGDRFEAIIAPCGLETRIPSMLNVFRALRRANLAPSDWVMIAVGKLKEALPLKWESLTEKKQTGPRRQIAVLPLEKKAA